MTLVVCRKMTKIDIDSFWLHIEKWWKWAIFGQKVRLWPWYFADKWPKLKLIHFDCTLKVMKMRHLWPKSKAITLVFCRKMTKLEIDWLWVHIEKWWQWAIFGQEVRLWPWYFADKWPKLKLSHFDCTLKSDEIKEFFAKK